MADDHIIRVIIQGYNRLSGVLKDAVNKAGPELDKLDNKLKNNQRQANRTSDEFSKMSDSMRKDGVEIDNTRKKLDRLGESVDKVRNKVKSGGLGNVARGFQIGRDISRDDDSEIEKRMQAARRFRTTEERALRLQLKEEQLQAERLSKLKQIQNEKLASEERSRANKEISDLKAQHALREEQIKKEIDAATEIKNSSALTPERTKELNDEISRRKKIIRDEIAALKQRENQIKTAKEETIAQLENEKSRLTSIRDSSRLQRDDRELSKQERAEARKTAQDAARNLQRRNASIRDERANSRQLVADAKQAAQFKIDAAQSEINAAQQELKGGKNTPEDISAANELIRERERVIREERENLKEEVNVINRRHKENVDTRKATLTDALKNEKIRLEGLNTNLRNAIPGAPSRAEVVKQFYVDRDKDISGLGKVERSAAKAAFAFEDFKRGVNGGRRDLAAFRGEAGKNQSAIAKLGAAFGEASRSVGKIINVRWNLILGAVQTLGTLVVEVGANLISLASSAVFAAGALGGAFLAAATQAVPVIGLLAATFKELQNAIKVVQLRQRANNVSAKDAADQAKAQKSAIQGLASAHYALKQAQQGVLDANIGVRDAHERVTAAIKDEKQSIIDLSKARRDAGRAIIDAAFAERDAELSLRDANLGVLDAKKQLADFEKKNRQDQGSLKDAQNAVREAQARLVAARLEGDQAQVSAAQQALGIANQNVSAIQDQTSGTVTQHKQLQLAVQQSVLTQQRAKVTLTRARVDNAQIQKQGVSGSPGVIAAQQRVLDSQRTYRDSVEGVRAAERRRADAEHAVAEAVIGISNAQDTVTESAGKMSAAQRNAQREFNKLSLPEKNFVLAAERLVRTWKKLVRPITDVITGAFTRLIGSVIKILQDPKIQSSLKILAGAIADGIDKFGKFLSDPETRRQLITFISEAAKNMPKIVDLFLHLFKIIMNIGEAAAPIFSSLLGGADSLLGRAERWTSPTPTAPAPTGGVRPDDRAGPIGAGIKNESPLQRFLGTASKNLTSWLHLIGAITRFFRYLFGGAQASGNSLVQTLTDAFNHWANWLRDNPEKVHKFFEEMRTALGALGTIVGRLAVGLLKAFSSKNAQDYTEFILTVVIPAILLMLIVIQKVTAGFVALTKVPVVGGVFKQIAIFAIAGGLLLKLFPILRLASFLFEALALAIAAVGLATVGWIVLAGLIVVAIVLILRHFHLLTPTLHILAETFKLVFGGIINTVKGFTEGIITLFTHPIRWLQQVWKKAIILFLFGPFDIVGRLLNKFFPGFQQAIYDGFIGAFKKLASWFAGIGKWLNDHIIHPIEHFFGIASPSKLMFRIGMNVVNGFLNAIKRLPGLVLGAIKGLPGLIIGLFKGLGGKIANALKTGAGALVSAGHWIAGKVGLGSHAIKASPEAIKTMVNEFTRLRAKGTGKNQAKQTEKKRHSGFEDIELEAFAKAAGYASGGHVRPDDRPGAKGKGSDTIPAWLSAGEWVLNKMQQIRLAKGVGVPIRDLSNFLFGSNTNKNPGIHGSGTQFVNPNDTENFVLHENTDSNGNTVSFIKFANGTYGQISNRAANKVRASGGTWFPGYAKRASSLKGGFFKDPTAARVMQKIGGLRSDAFDRRFAKGGLVSAYAGGGVVNSPAGRTKGGNTVNQHFAVKVEGDSDWNYAMRVGAMHAQEAY